MPRIDMKATGSRIRHLRDLNGLTNKDIQSVFGFGTPQAIYKWMRGDALPSVDNLVILADLFNVTINDILVINKDDDNDSAVA